MLANALPPVLSAPVAAPSPAPAAGSGNEPGSFARMLDAADARRQAQAQAQAKSQADASAAARQSVPGQAAAQTATAKPEADAPAAGAATGGAEGTEATPAEADSTETRAAAAEAVLDPSPIDDPAPATDAAALLAGLAAQPRPPAAEAAGPGAASRGGRTAPRDAGDTEAANRVQASANSVADVANPAVAGARRSGGGAAAGAGADSGPARDAFTPLMRQAREDAGAAAATDTGARGLQAAAARSIETRPEGVDSLTPGTALLAAAATPGVAAGSAAAGAHARLAASPGSPEFAGQLGAQLTTFVRDGVQHARLELHPLELGPVTVQIAIDGAQARVNLAAEHAATRQALEQAMPALAGSLREAGLTLAGGGVFEQPRQPQPDGGAAADGGRGGRDGSAGRGETAGITAVDGHTAAASGTAVRRRGVVDLVA